MPWEGTYSALASASVCSFFFAARLARFSFLETTFSAFFDAFPMEKTSEKTIEINPDYVTKSKLESLYQLGFNRISLGAQSFIQSELTFLGRTHSPQKTQDTVFMIKEVGFNNLNLDYMFGLPNTTTSSVEHSLKTLLSLEPKHISTYGLSIEKGTPFYRNKIQKLQPEHEAKQYRIIQNTLKEHAFQHYEVSNFSKQTYQ